MLSTSSLGRSLCVASFSLLCRHSKRFFPAKRKRFYKDVGIVNFGGNFEVCLDQRKLKTPLGKVFAVPNEALAVAVATEWDSQRTEINQHEMHLTGLCNTVLDNPSHKTVASVATEVMEFLENDTLCYRMREPEELATLQEQKWDPILWWYEKRYGARLETWSDLVPSKLPEQTYNAIFKHLVSYSLWGITGIQYSTESLKSLVLCQAAVDQYMDVEHAVALSRLESEFQTGRWGRVEWAHDLDREQTQSRVAAGVLFTQLTSECMSTVAKGPQQGQQFQENLQR